MSDSKVPALKKRPGSAVLKQDRSGREDKSFGGRANAKLGAHKQRKNLVKGEAVNPESKDFPNSPAIAPKGKKKRRRRKTKPKPVNAKSPIEDSPMPEDDETDEELEDYSDVLAIAIRGIDIPDEMRRWLVLRRVIHECCLDWIVHRFEVEFSALERLYRSAKSNAPVTIYESDMHDALSSAKFSRDYREDCVHDECKEWWEEHMLGDWFESGGDEEEDADLDQRGKIILSVIKDVDEAITPSNVDIGPPPGVPSPLEYEYEREEKAFEPPLPARPEKELDAPEQGLKSEGGPPAISGKDSKQTPSSSALKGEKGVSKGPNPAKDRRRFPAVRNHSHRDTVTYPPITYYVPVSRSWTQTKIDILSQYHVSVLEDVHRFDRDNKHPLCAAFRAIAEAEALKCAINEMAARGITGTVVDVGGAINRHHSNKREYVWSCNPDNTPKDLLRRFTLLGDRFCNHFWQECDCTNNAISISVHSLYYLSPLEICDRLLRQQVPAHFAVLHLYDKGVGTLMDDEMTYVMRNGLVYVTALGNLQPYVHGDMAWLKKGSWNDGKRTLTWEIDRQFLDVYVIKFVAYAGVVKPAIEFGASDGLLVEEAIEEVKFEQVVNDCIAPHKSLNRSNRESFLERVVRKGRASGLRIFRLVTFADKAFMAQPVALVETPWYTPWVASIRESRMTMEASWRLWVNAMLAYIVPVVLLAIIIMILNDGLGRINISPEAESIKNFATGIVSHQYFLYLIELIILCGAVYMLVGQRRNYRLPFSIFHVYQNILKGVHAISPRHVGCKAKVINYCCTYPDKEVDKRKLKSLKLPRDYDEDCVRKDAAYAMVYHPLYAPYFPAGCSHNAVCSLKNKLCQVIPGAGRYSYKLHPVLVGVAKIINGLLVPMEWAEWLIRFPSAKREKLMREKASNSDWMIELWNKTGFFTKFEAYSEPKYPRPIGGAAVELNFSLGRYLIRIAELLANLLPKHLLFPIHGDADEIGDFYYTYKQYKKLDCDFSAFDSSQTEEALELVAEFVSLCGVPKPVVDRMRLDKESIKITTRKGMKATCAGFRVSGRSETLLGNTLITINTALHVFGNSLVAGMFKGDDTVVFLRHGSYDVTTLTQKYLKQGLVAKLREVDDYEVEFCSSLFIPTSLGYVLSPKPGKILAKTLWCRNLEYSPKQIEEQFASILKGLSNATNFIPGFRGLFANEVFRSLHESVTSKIDEYGEYSHREHACTEETIDYMINRYGLDKSDFDDLESELARTFPVRLSSFASQVMIEKDWGPQNDGEHLREFFKLSKDDTPLDILNVVIAPAIEESFRYIAPIFTTLFLSVVESIHYCSVLPILAHGLFLWFQWKVGFGAAWIAHMYLNYLAAGSISYCIFNVLRMPSRKRTPKKRAKRSPVANGGNNRTKKRNRQKRSKSGSLAPYAALIADPCGAPLVPGVYGSTAGMLTRYKTMFSPSQTEGTGYLLWDPLGTTNGDGTAMSCFYFANDAWDFKPINTPGSPLGTGTVTSTGLAIEETGANSFLNSDIVQDFRTVSACMRLNYAGTTSACSGRIAYIENLPISALVGKDYDNSLSVKGLFQLASKVERVPLDTCEVTWRPDEESASFFRQSGMGTLTAGGGSQAVPSADTKTHTRTLFGFAWDAVKSHDLRFDFVQNVEWRAAPYEGYISLVPKQVSPPLVNRVLAYLDSNYPGWSTTMARHGANLAARVANMALAGSGLSAGLLLSGNGRRNMIAFH